MPKSDLITLPSHLPKGLRYYDLIGGLFVAVLLISNIAATKLVGFGIFPFDGGTFLFPLSYIFGDVLTEVYGFARARRIIWMGFAANILAALTFATVAAMPPASIWPNQDAFVAILGFVPRIVLASLVAYLCGEFTNSVILAKMKVAMKGRVLWARTITSTLAGQAVDTGIFVVIAFLGIVPARELWLMIAFNYVFKCGVEIVLTPVTYAVVGFLKRREQVDVFDSNTRFSPFGFRDAAPAK
ncbi:MAG: queuosine precursor transporter [Calditrichaeota bacterium]|nr:queuosine precursor transporter [Calditrichota bacterium]MCB9365735.1 queuosine precursor transporter [Calditrichota bacterium]